MNHKHEKQMQHETLPLKVELVNRDLYICWQVRVEKFDMLSIYYNKDMRNCIQVIQLQMYSENHDDLYEVFISASQRSWVIRNVFKDKYHAYRITICIKLKDEVYLPLLTTMIGNFVKKDESIPSERNMDWPNLVCGYSYYQVKQSVTGE